MNNALAWIKSNWIIVVLAAVTVISLPTMLFFSSRMNAALRADMQKRIDADYAEFRNPRIQYALTSSIPGVAGIEHSAPPNQLLIDFFEKHQKLMGSQAVQVWEQCLAFNRGSRKVLMEGFFPQPQSSADERFVRTQFLRAYVAQAGEMLKRMKAGTPPDPERLVAELRNAVERWRKQVEAQRGEGELRQEQRDQIMRELLDIRRERYLTRAAEIEVYADPTIFSSDIPDRPQDIPPTQLGFYWEACQEPLWGLSDVVDAIVLANRTDRQQPGVPGSVVKRILRIESGPLVEPLALGGDGDDFESFRRRQNVSSPGLVELDHSASLTGRVSGPRTSNQLYDVRTITLEAVMATQRIPEFIEALARVNLMTVLDLDLVSVDKQEELNQGFYYGDDHVVRATLQIETIWLREWTVPHMPVEVRNRRGVEEPANRDG